MEGKSLRSSCAQKRGMRHSAGCKHPGLCRLRRLLVRGPHGGFMGSRGREVVGRLVSGVASRGRGAFPSAAMACLRSGRLVDSSMASTLGLSAAEPCSGCSTASAESLTCDRGERRQQCRGGKGDCDQERAGGVRQPSFPASCFPSSLPPTLRLQPSFTRPQPARRAPPDCRRA
jgi:hypothetical protein